MPLYEYQCDACEHRFEVIQKYSDAPIAVCPACGGAVRKLLSSPAIQFKGTGWYITDYARAGKSDTGGSTGKTDGGAGAGSDTKTEARSEGKADGKTEAKSEPKSDAKVSSGNSTSD